MLQSIRENLKYLSWVLWIVIAAFIAALFFDFGSLGGMTGTGGDAAAARVAGEPITYDELREQHRQLDQRRRLALQAVALPPPVAEEAAGDEGEGPEDQADGAHRLHRHAVPAQPRAVHLAKIAKRLCVGAVHRAAAQPAPGVRMRDPPRR